MKAVTRDATPLRGCISGWIASTQEDFTSCPEPFPCSPDFGPNWVDLGEKDFFLVTPSIELASVYEGLFMEGLSVKDPSYSYRIKRDWADILYLPFKITNSSGQSLIADFGSIKIFIVRDGALRRSTSRSVILLDPPWKVMNVSGPVLAPGTSAFAQNAHKSLKSLYEEGYQPGARMVASLGGHIPNTNQIFECYSAPFELPPLPKGPPKR